MTSDHPVKRRKKLIEVAIPLEAINSESVRESYIYKGNPSSVHKWWAQRPFAAARAVLFAQLVDDPSDLPEEFSNEVEQTRERERLFSIIRRLAKWESINQGDLYREAVKEIQSCFERFRTDNPSLGLSADDMPTFLDPFSGGATIPIEAQRLGLQSEARDLNPIPVLIAKSLIDLPHRYASIAPVGDHPGKAQGLTTGIPSMGSLQEDILHYRDLLAKELREERDTLYPELMLTESMLPQGRANRAGYEFSIGQRVRPFAYLWARTVPSPNPLYEEKRCRFCRLLCFPPRRGKKPGSN